MQAWMYVYEAVYVLTVPELNGLLASRIQMSVFEKIGREVFNNDDLRLLTVPIFWEGTKKNEKISHFVLTLLRNFQKGGRLVAFS